MKHLFIILLLFCSLFVQAQIKWENPNYREKTIAVVDSMVLDSLQILPEKFNLKKISGEEISPDLYEVKGNVLYLKSIKADSLKASYYIHPHFKTIVTYPEDPSLIVPSASEKMALVLDNQEQKETAIFDGLNSEGTLVRGLMFGNNQGSSVESSLNLRLDGKLSENVGVQAYVSDTNAPLEVDGYTQSLDQFERIYIELFTKKSKIRAGHIDLEQRQDYFGRFNRKVTGLKVSHLLDSENSSTFFEAAGSLSRGQFTRQEFLGTEGNQGPYRLKGNGNEAYVLIIAGSERVYRNGKLLEYGENKDYVLDYSTGEITFTSQHLVTANDRFIIEYQYTNRNYNRFTWFAGAEHKNEKFKISGHIFSESDNKNNPINQNLSEEDLKILSNASNNPQNLYAESAKPATYEEGRILYKKIYVNGRAIYEYSNSSNDQLYQVNFTYLGKNQGNYILNRDGVNGRVFQYIPPVNGTAQGDYAPVNLLVAPERKQVISLSTAYLMQNGSLHLDVGLSNNDANLFSEKGNDENIGLGLKLSGQKDLKFTSFNLKPNFSYELIQAKFKPIERLRTPEFARDFNLNHEIGNQNQHFLQSNMLLFASDSTQANYGFDYLKQGNIYQGFRHRFNGLFHAKGYTFYGNGSYLKTTSDSIKSNFFRYDFSVYKKIKNIRLEGGMNGESNRNQAYAKDSLSNRWNEFYATAMLGDSLQRHMQLRVYQRTDDSTRLGNLSPYSKAWGIQFKSRIIQSTHQTLEFLADYRNVRYENELEDASFLNTKIKWRKSFLNNGLNLNVKYELSGRTEQQRAFVYAKVADGLGIYKWIDFNNDGIQQIDEFEVAEFVDQANYVRVFTNVVQSININQNKLGLNLSIYPSRFLKSQFWNRIQSRMIYNVGGNYLKENKMAAWNPFNQNATRGNTYHIFIQNKYNQGKNYKWHLLQEFKIQKNSNLIYTGMESMLNQNHQIDLRYDINKFIQAQAVHNLQKIKSDSEFFTSRRYLIQGQDFSPQVNLKFSNDLKPSIAYVYKVLENQTGNEKLKAQQFNFSLTWDKSNKTSVFANLDWVKNDFIGDPDNLVANRMMQGLRKGNNLVWNLNVSRNINSFMVLNLQYNGRKNENLNAIHTGNMQVRLNF